MRTEDVVPRRRFSVGDSVLAGDVHANHLPSVPATKVLSLPSTRDGLIVVWPLYYTSVEVSSMSAIGVPESWDLPPTWDQERLSCSLTVQP